MTDETKSEEVKEVLKATFSVRGTGWTAPWAEEEREVDAYVNPGDWWGETYVVYIECGYVPALVVVEAGSEQDALDALIDDGSWNHLFVVDDDEPEESWHSYGGNYGVRYDTEAIHFIVPCEITEWYSVYPRKGRYEW